MAGETAAAGLPEARRGAAGTVAILSANPIHDTGGGQRSAQIALELLHRDFAVVFVSHGEVTETVDLGLRYDHPRLVRWSLAEALDETRRRDLLAALSEGSGAVVTQVPARDWRPVVEAADARGVPTVYDCIDRWDSELGRGWYRRGAEVEIARASSVLTASAPALVDHVESLTGRETALVPNAFNARIFDDDADLERPRDMPQGRVALYVGALWGGWMDWALVRTAAEALTDTSLVFVGDRRKEGGGLPERCVFTGLRPQTRLPAYLAHADVAFLPWHADDVTAATSPLKVYEFLAMGLPVVGPDIEPLRGMPGVRTAVDAERFVEALASTGRGTLTTQERRAMQAFARQSSWGERVDRILSLVREARASAAGHRSTGAPGGSRAASRHEARSPGVSVVIPAYQHERWIGEALDSVADQTLPAGEVVVVDDGSTDGTADVVAAHPLPALRLVRQANRGAHHALNRAVRLARGEWIAILNSDDAFEPERLEHAWGVARETGAALACGSVRLVDGRGGPVDASHEIARWYADARSWALEAGSLAAALRRHNVAVTTSNFFLHRTLWERLGGFRAYRYVHDYDFLLRAVRLCPDRIVHEPALEGVLYRVHEANTITERREAAAAEREEMRRSLRHPLARLRGLARRGTLGAAVTARVDASSVLAPIPPARAAAGVAPGPGSRPPLGGEAAPTVGLAVDSLGTGGLEEVVALLAQALPAVGVPTAVLCASAGGPVARRLQDAGVPVHVLDGALDGVEAWVGRTGVAAVSSHFAPPALVEALGGAGVPVVETVQNCYAWLDNEGWVEESRRLRAVSRVVAVSDTVAAYYRDRTGRAAEDVVPNAVHPARVARVPEDFARRSLELAADAPVLAFVGRITEQKNPGGLLEAFARARQEVPEAILVLAGPADRSASLSRLRRRHADLFRRGGIRHVASPRHVGTVLSASDGYVSNAFYEGWSVAASEAAWTGLPLVLSETGGSAELVGSASERGRMVPNAVGDPLSVGPARVDRPDPEAWRANVEGMSQAMTAVVRDRESWRGRRKEISSWARAELAPEVIARRYAGILLDVARR